MTDGQPATLVTGATGFLGRRLCQRLQASGTRVLAAGRNPQQGPWDQFIVTDLSREGIPVAALKGVTTVFHLASKAHAVSESASAADSYRPVIVEGTRRLLDASREAGVEKFIYISSVKAMGEGNPPGAATEPIGEDTPCTPSSPYGLAKAEAEGLVRDSGLEHPVILRPVMVFGPGEKGNLPRMIAAIRANRFPPLPETGNHRSMIHVDDVVKGCLLAALKNEAAGRTYILTHPEALSTRALYDCIREALGLPRRDWAVPLILLRSAAACGSALGTLLRRRMPLDRDTLSKLTGSAWYSGARARRELGFEPACSVREWLNSGRAIS